jgi:hypothetical protein
LPEKQTRRLVFILKSGSEIDMESWGCSSVLEYLLVHIGLGFNFHDC